jgi:hypothetical protein
MKLDREGVEKQSQIWGSGGFDSEHVPIKVLTLHVCERATGPCHPDPPVYAQASQGRMM